MTTKLTVIHLHRFQLFHSKTGVTGPYTFGVGLATYMLSKEIYVMEHEYYTGLSILVMVYFATTKFGPGIAKWLDKEVDVRISIAVSFLLKSEVDNLG